MKVLVIFAIVFVALEAVSLYGNNSKGDFEYGSLLKAERDWSKILIKDRKVALVEGHPVPHKPSARITHGNEAVPHSRPWQVGLFVETSEGFLLCSGSLIDDLNVLTSAYCLSFATGNIQVVFGAQNILAGDEATQVTENSGDYVQHKLYDSYYLRNDIGLIRLPRPVTFNENIQPISVDNSTCSDDYVGRDVNVSGWGRDSDSTNLISSALREVTMPVIDNQQCISYYGPVIQWTHVCTDTSGGKSTCNGDNGGPLVLDGRKQIGIVSFVANAGCEAGYPAGFTRVCKFSSWIEENKKQPSGSSSRISVCSNVILLLLLFIFIIC